MNLIPTLSTHLFAYRRLDDETIDLASGAGFSALEIFAAPQHFPIRDERALFRIARAVERSGVTIQAVHAPFYRSIEEIRAGKAFALGDRDPGGRREAFEALRILFGAASNLGTPDIVLHMGHGGPEDFDAGLFTEGVAEALGEAASYSGRVLLENTPRAASSLGELASAAAAMDPARTGICLDLGHLRQVSGDPACGLGAANPAPGTPAETLARRLRHVHAHDNGGGRDEHLPPGRGSIDWESILAWLGSLPQRLGFSLEIGDPSRGTRPIREVLRNALDGIRGPVRDFLWQQGIGT